MNIDFDSLRPELTFPSVMGASPVRSVADLMEARAGRVITTAEASREDLNSLALFSETVEKMAHLSVLRAGDLVLPSIQQVAAIQFDTESGCWHRTTSDSHPYGHMRVRGLDDASDVAHRAMYKVFFGAQSLPNDTDNWLDHVCERKSCCYPRHMERLTHIQNTRRGHLRGGRRPGPEHPTLSFNFD
jgi:hypothetical protein